MFPTLIEQYLQRMTWDDDGWPRGLTLPAFKTATVVVDVARAYGHPLLVHGDARIEDVVGRFEAGDDLDDIAADSTCSEPTRRTLFVSRSDTAEQPEFFTDRSLEATIDSIAQSSGEEARAYRDFMKLAFPVVQAVMPAIRGEVSARELPGRILNLARVFRRGPLEAGRDLLAPYDTLLRRHLTSDLTRGPVAAFAAHAAVSPTLPGGALYAFWQAAYHIFGQWHAVGGAQALTDALVRRLAALGGTLRCATPVERIEAPHGRVNAVVLTGGERIPAETVITAINPQVALLDLLDPPLSGRDGADLRAVRRGNVVQALIHIAVDRLPQYPNARAGDNNGLQRYVDRLDDITTAWATAEARRLPDPLPLYAFTISALDSTLATPGRHTVYLACPAAPSSVDGGWPARTDEFVERALAVVESRAPGFGASITGMAPWTPDLMEAQGRWPGAHPMHLDIALDQLGPLRPTRRLGGHRTPVDGLFISGAGTSPAGGSAGTPGRTPGRMAARAALRRRP